MQDEDTFIKLRVTQFKLKKILLYYNNKLKVSKYPIKRNSKEVQTTKKQLIPKYQLTIGKINETKQELNGVNRVARNHENNKVIELTDGRSNDFDRYFYWIYKLKRTTLMRETESIALGFKQLI